MLAGGLVRRYGLGAWIKDFPQFHCHVLAGPRCGSYSRLIRARLREFSKC
jgi:hypothetical protein